MTDHPIRFDALAVADATGFQASPGSLLLRPPDRPGDLPTLLAAGHTPDVARHPAAQGAAIVRRPAHVLLPGLVNAHTHLDLTHLGPQPYDPAGGFVGWVDVVRSRRALAALLIRDSVRRGISLARAGGTVAVGDIAGAPRGTPSLVPAATLRDSPLLGVSFLEFFAIGTAATRGIAALDLAISQAALPWDGPGPTLGIQPHAPYTVSLPAYAHAISLAHRLRLPICTHLAESPEERRFISRGDGPMRDMLQRFGLWDSSVAAEIGRGLSPVGHLAHVLNAARPLVVHVNDADDADIQTLAHSRAAVAYCPRASAYFGAQHAFGPHRYTDMIDAGITVALGTDSIVNLWNPGETGRGPLRLSVLDDARFLRRRDTADPRLLLEMATTAGARALGLNESWFTLRPEHSPRPIAGLVAVEIADNARDPLAAVMDAPAPPELLLDRCFAPGAWRWHAPGTTRVAPCIDESAAKDPG